MFTVIKRRREIVFLSNGNHMVRIRVPISSENRPVISCISSISLAYSLFFTFMYTALGVGYTAVTLYSIAILYVIDKGAVIEIK